MVVDAANPVYDSREDCNAIIHTSTNELIAGCKNSHIPNSVTSLGDACFFGCSNLTAITIPNSVTRLGDGCFAGCSSLTAITIPNSVTSLGTGCFAYCSSLERMVVDAANPVYDSREDCNAIIHTSTNELIAGCKNSHIPNSVTSLVYGCFWDCSSLTAIYMLPSTPPSRGYGMFDNTPLEKVYVVDEDAKTAYQAQAPWSEYEIVVMPTDIEEVGTDKTAPTIVGYYDLNGKLINGKQRGAVIVRYSDGTTRKMLK